jgi:hypothetical protein
MTETFALLSGLFMCVAGPPYLISILRHETKPERASWFIWSVLGLVAFTSQIGLHAHWSLMYAGINAFGNLAVFGLSLHYGIGGWKKLDVLSFVIAIAGVAYAVAAHNPLYALAGVLTANFAGTVPTWYKVYYQPKSESSIAWFFIGTSALFGAFSVGSLNAKLLLLPVYMVFATYGVLAAQTFGRMAAGSKKRRKRKRLPARGQIA